MDAGQIERTPNHARWAERMAAAAIICVLALTPGASAEKRIVKALNEQLGKTAEELQQGQVGRLERMPAAAWHGWTVYGTQVQSVWQYLPGVPAYTESRTTTTGGDRTVISPDGTMAVTIPGTAQSTTVTTPHPGVAASAYRIDYRVFFLVPPGAETVYGWQAYSRTDVDAVLGSPDSGWRMVDAWVIETDKKGRVRPVRDARKGEYTGFWFAR